MTSRRLLAASALALAVSGTGMAGLTGTAAARSRGARPLDRIKHVVVIYEENHSFDNLYGGWEGVNGRGRASRARAAQVRQDGTRYRCLLQVDVNLASPPLSSRCEDTNTKSGETFQSHFSNYRQRHGGTAFAIDDYIKPGDTTCPDPGAAAGSASSSGANGGNGVRNGDGLPGGCTRDLVHRYYQEQYQLDGGRQDRYTTGSDAAGLTQGYYRTRSLPIYDYLHRRGHPRYAISDAFFQAAFGGSFLNHQWLIAAHTPWFDHAASDGSATDLHSVTDTNAMPNGSYPLYKATIPGVKDQALTEACSGSSAAQHQRPQRDAAHGNAVCGDWAVNTVQPAFQPYAPGTPEAKRLPALRDSTIGDRLSARNVSWAWYSGGWSNADGRRGRPGWTNGDGPGCSDPGANPKATYPNCPDRLFQFHHQPFNYYASYAPGQPARAQHLRDEREFIDSARASGKQCRLRSVSFVKPLGNENEHPGYASEAAGSSHLVRLLRTVEGGACAKDTMVVVTYDEFGGEWDHVPPPGQGKSRGPHDAWGPGTRIPALTLSPALRAKFVVDHKRHDTTSIMATIEHRFGLRALGSRDAAVADLGSVFRARGPRRR